MDAEQSLEDNKLTKHFVNPTNPGKLIILVAVTSIVLGTLTGYLMSQNGGSPLQSPGNSKPTTGSAKNPEQDSRTFKDFAEGTLKAKPQPKEGDYSEGTHVLQRQGAIPVALTSSVVDLSEFEGKKVKVFGETQKALKEGWLMDVGKVEEVK